ncbi:MAG TPA: hypothetical protein VGM24_01095, partial [Puia sp.]
MDTSRLVLFSFLALCFSCGNRRQEKNINVPGKIRKIPVTRDQVYDLSGYADGRGNPFNLFDENAYVDPRYTRAGEPYIPVTDCQPTLHPEIYFPAGIGSRIVVDLLVPYDLKEIYLYDRSSVSDSVWIYSGTMKHWQQITALETASEPGSRGWKKISADIRSRFVMIRFSSNETRITEMVLYGTAAAAIPP